MNGWEIVAIKSDDAEQPKDLPDIMLIQIAMQSVGMMRDCRAKNDTMRYLERLRATLNAESSEDDGWEELL